MQTQTVQILGAVTVLLAFAIAELVQTLIPDTLFLPDRGAAYVVRFEGGSACDGCGEVEGLVDAGGAPLEDTLCVDWSAYNDWEDRPWWP